jgi:adhesin transport system outer membrane protein
MCCLVAASPLSAQTLEQAVAITLATNPEINSIFNEFLSVRKRNDAAGSAYKPSIDLDAGIGYEGINPTPNSGTGLDTEMTRKEATISLTQLLWDGSSTLNDIARTAAEAESARSQLLADAEDKALQVSQIYLDAVKATEVLSLSEGNLTVHKKIYKDIKKRAVSGIGSTADVSQVEARIAKAHANLLVAQNNLIDSHIQFRKVVGQEPLSLVYPRADISMIPLSLSDALADALDQHPVIKVASADVDSAHFQYKQSKGVNYPTLSIEASQSWRDDTGGYEGSSQETLAMLRMRYNLYNGGADSANSAAAVYQLNKAKDLRDRAYRQVEEGLRLSWSALELTLQQKDFLSDQVDSTSETVIAYGKQYRIGKRTLLDVLNTENELFEARKEYLDTHYSEQYAKYRVMHATGSLLNALLVDIPDQWATAMEY